MNKTYRITLLSEAMAPITHMSGSVGNEGIVAREPVHTERGVVYVPFLSGNALRHRCVREPAAKWLIDAYGLRGRLTLPQLNMLLHGGNLSESTAHENTRRIAEFRRVLPALKIAGGCLPNQVLSGDLDAWRGTLVCEENRSRLKADAGEAMPTKRLQSSEVFIGNWQYTRGDAGKLGEAHNDDDTAPSNLMIFSGQCVIRGAMFLHGFSLRHASRVEVGALLFALQLWQADGGTIGGQAARGHGILKTEIIGDIDQEGLAAEYRDYAMSVRDDAVQWLYDAFAKREEKPAKAKKAKAAV